MLIYTIPHTASGVLLMITLWINKELDRGDFPDLFDTTSGTLSVLSIIIIIGPWLFLMYCFQLFWNKINGPQPEYFGRGKTNVGI